MAEILNTITKGLAWLFVGWHVLAFIAVAIILTWEHFTRPPEPTADEIKAVADTYEAQYGEAAYQQIGRDMYDERVKVGSGTHYRFLRTVSGELIRRMLQRANTRTSRVDHDTNAQFSPARAPKQID